MSFHLIWIYFDSVRFGCLMNESVIAFCRKYTKRMNEQYVQNGMKNVIEAKLKLVGWAVGGWFAFCWQRLNVRYSLDADFRVLMKKLVEKWHANDFRTKPTVITHLIKPIYLLCEFSNVERGNRKKH